MRTYYLYLIEDEFAKNYFGREIMFFQLFKEYEESKLPIKSIIEKQINYITKPIPGIRLHQYLGQHLSRMAGFSYKKGTYFLKDGKNSYAELKIFDRYLHLIGKGNFNAETTFFEILRKYEGAYFAVDIENERYGWLKPVKERKFV